MADQSKTFYAPEGIVTTSERYGSSERREEFIKDTKERDTDQLRKDIGNLTAKAKDALIKAAPEGEGSGFRAAALFGEDFGKTDAEVVQTLAEIQDKMSMSKAVLREREYANRIHSGLRGEVAEDEAAQMHAREHTHEGRARNDIGGAAPSPLALISRVTNKVRDHYAQHGSLAGLNLSFKDVDIAPSEYFRAANTFSVKESNESSPDEGWTPEVTRSGFVSLHNHRRATLYQVLPKVNMRNGGYKFVQESAVTEANNKAAPIAEEAAYPDQKMHLADVEVTARKVANFMSVTDEQLDDVSEAANYINYRLPFYLMSRVDAQIVTGDATAPNWNGLTNTTGTGTTNTVAAAKTTGDFLFNFILDRIIAAETNSPAPVDIITMKSATLGLLQKQNVSTTDGRYIAGEPLTGQFNRVWGVPIVVCEAVEANTAYLGVSMDIAIGEQQGIELMWGMTGTDFKNGRQSVRASLRGNMIYRKAAGTWQKLTALNTANPS